MSVEETTGTVCELTWTKSSYSGASGGQCVEVAGQPGAVHVRDSKDTARPMLTVGPQGWASFLEFATQS